MKMTYETRAELIHCTGHQLSETNAADVAYDEPRKWGSTDETVTFAHLAINAMVDEGYIHDGYTYNGGDVLHVFRPDAKYFGAEGRYSESIPKAWAFVANTTMGTHSALCHLTEEEPVIVDGRSLSQYVNGDGFKAPEGWRLMKRGSVLISLGHGMTSDVG